MGSMRIPFARQGIQYVQTCVGISCYHRFTAENISLLLTTENMNAVFKYMYHDIHYIFEVNSIGLIL